jgi:hypothetical protein
MNQAAVKARHVRVPAFLPVTARPRSDGWSAFRQAAFLVALARTGEVRLAVREVGMSRASAYALRKRPGAESFAPVWDKVQRGDRSATAKLTPELRVQAAIGGLIKPQIWRRRCIGLVLKPSNSALLTLLAQLDRGSG